MAQNTPAGPPTCAVATAQRQNDALSIVLKADAVLPVFKHPVALVLMLIPFLDSSHSIAELH